MNEFIFLSYILVVCFSLLIALSLGKEALISLICLFSVLVNLFVTKKINLLGFSATASDALAVGITLGLNLLQEYFGKKTAIRTIWISFFCSVTYLIFSYLHLYYLPATSDISQQSFEIILTPMARIIASSLLVFILVQHLDCFIYRILYQRYGNQFYILRNYSSSAITQFADTLLFTFLGLYQLNENFTEIKTMLNIITISYCIKLITIGIATPFLTFSKKIVVKNELF